MQQQRPSASKNEYIGEMGVPGTQARHQQAASQKLAGLRSQVAAKIWSTRPFFPLLLGLRDVEMQAGSSQGYEICFIFKNGQ